MRTMRNTINFNGGDYVCVRNLLSWGHNGDTVLIYYSVIYLGYVDLEGSQRKRKRGREREKIIYTLDQFI